MARDYCLIQLLPHTSERILAASCHRDQTAVKLLGLCRQDSVAGSHVALA